MNDSHAPSSQGDMEDLENNVNSTVTYSDLRKLFHLPLKLAAKSIQICSTLFKTYCRRQNISKWPYRQIKGIIKALESLRIATLNDNIDTIDRQRMYEHISILYHSLDLLLYNPNLEIDLNEIAIQVDRKFSSQYNQLLPSHSHMTSSYPDQQLLSNQYDQIIQGTSLRDLNRTHGLEEIHFNSDIYLLPENIHRNPAVGKTKTKSSSHLLSHETDRILSKSNSNSNTNSRLMVPEPSLQVQQLLMVTYESINQSEEYRKSWYGSQRSAYYDSFIDSEFDGIVDPTTTTKVHSSNVNNVNVQQQPEQRYDDDPEELLNKLGAKAARLQDNHENDSEYTYAYKLEGPVILPKLQRKTRPRPKPKPKRSSVQSSSENTTTMNSTAVSITNDIIMEDENLDMREPSMNIRYEVDFIPVFLLTSHKKS